jgi:molybdopterin/thiamine biosynthesis adenylyltransferase
MGGLGSTAAFYLAGAGVGKIGLVDYDIVEVSNLQRQIIHSEETIGIPKVISARDTLLKFNSSIEYIPHITPITSKNALDIINQYDIIIDASDNVATRYLLNDSCVLLNKVLVSGKYIYSMICMINKALHLEWKDNVLFITTKMVLVIDVYFQLHHHLKQLLTVQMEEY